MATQRSSAAHTAEVEKLSIQRVLCPIDFSSHSMAALGYAIGLARHFDSKLIVRHVSELPASLLMAGGDATAISEWRNQIPNTRKDLEKVVRQAGVKDSEAEVNVLEGPVLDTILRIIQKERIDLTVMGTHGRQGFERMILGSVAEGVIHHSVSPVMVVNHPEGEFVRPEDAEPVQLDTILVATDFSPRSDPALTYALKWACEWAAHLVVLHTVPKLPKGTAGMLELFPEYNPYFERQLAKAWDEIRNVVPESVQRWCKVSYEVRHGDPKEEIVRVAEEKEADLIVLGARGAGSSSATWGSVSSAVVRSGRLPAMVVREL